MILNSTDLAIIRQIWLKTAAVEPVPWDDPEVLARSPWADVLREFKEEVKAQQLETPFPQTPEVMRIQQEYARTAAANAAERFLHELTAAKTLINLGEVAGLTAPGRSLALPILIYEAARAAGHNYLPPVHIFPFKRLLDQFARVPEDRAQWEKLVAQIRAELVAYEQLLRELYPLTPEQRKIRQKLLERLPLEAEISGKSLHDWAGSAERPIFMLDIGARGRTYDAFFTRLWGEPIAPNSVIPLYMRYILPDAFYDETPHGLSEPFYALSDFARLQKGYPLDRRTVTMRVLPPIEMTPGADLPEWHFHLDAPPKMDPLRRPLIQFLSYPHVLARAVELAGQQANFQPFIDAAKVLRALPPQEVPEAIDLANLDARLAKLGLNREALLKLMESPEIRSKVNYNPVRPFRRIWDAVKALTAPEVPIKIP